MQFNSNNSVSPVETDTIIHTIGVFGLALLWWLLKRDRVAIDKQISDLVQSAKLYNNDLGNHKTSLAVTMAGVKRLESDVKELKEGQNNINENVNTILLEIRKR